MGARKNDAVRIAATIAAVYAAAVAWSCAPKSAFRLGFSTALTGRQSSLGRDVYEGALLAGEEISADRRKTPIELIVRDDAADPERALANAREFAELGIEATAGHSTSAVAAAVLPFLQEKGMVFFGATVSSSAFDGKDDPLYRVVSSALAGASALVEHLAESGERSSFVAVYDRRNAAYVEPWVRTFVDLYRLRGGEVADPVSFDSSAIGDYEAAVARAVAAAPSAAGLCVVASPIDTAAICQAFRRRVESGPIVTSGWAGNPDLIKQGGRAVEGVLHTESYDSSDGSAEHLAFRERFRGRFGREPTFGAVHSYESILYLSQAIDGRRRGENLRSALARVESLRGVQGEIRFDPTGDAIRAVYLIDVRDGAFVTIAKIEGAP